MSCYAISQLPPLHFSNVGSGGGTEHILYIYIYTHIQMRYTYTHHVILAYNLIYILIISASMPGSLALFGFLTLAYYLLPSQVTAKASVPGRMFRFFFLNCVCCIICCPVLYVCIHVIHIWIYMSYNTYMNIYIYISIYLSFYLHIYIYISIYISYYIMLFAYRWCMQARIRRIYVQKRVDMVSHLRMDITMTKRSRISAPWDAPYLGEVPIPFGKLT